MSFSLRLLMYEYSCLTISFLVTGHIKMQSTVR